MAIGEYYKVTNLSIEPCTMTWNYALLDNNDKVAYDDYKHTPDYVGTNETDKAQKEKVAESVKTRGFFQGFGKDVQVKVYDKVQQGENAITQARYEWRFCIGPNTERLVKEGDLLKARQVCEKWEVNWNRDDSVEDLAGKLNNKFGHNVRILTQSQWTESGLQAREKKEIKLKLRPGETKARVVTEGYLEAYPMTANEAEAYLADETDRLKSQIAEDKERTVEAADDAKEEKEVTQELKKNLDVDALDRDGMKKALDDLGVDYKGNASNDSLRKLLRSEIEKR